MVTSQTSLPFLKRVHYNKSRPAKQIIQGDSRYGKSNNNCWKTILNRESELLNDFRNAYNLMLRKRSLKNVDI